ncbi:MAG: hypothetical protein K0U47_12445 [Epsilonproteobacteria bacterium]|nr:hypothetical protein [Campylobacterota bacterium]
MIKKTTLSLVLSSQMVLYAASNAELEAELKALKSEFQSYKKEQQANNETLIEEIENAKDPSFSGDPYESVSALGKAASKVYHSNSVVSLGGYGSYKYKKYTDFKNYSDSVNNDTRETSETNVVRFVPYFGFKFNDWIVMNTEVEFEDGGARSDGEKNYKYVIVEFSYLDFLFDEAYNLRIGHILTPFGNINLNHEPTSYLTAERPLVETYIIPSTWHTNGALLYGNIKEVDYYVGIVTSPDAGKFTEGRFIQQGRLGARQFTDDLSFVARGAYTIQPGLDIGGSLYYGQSSVLAQDKPGATVNTLEADVSITMAEAHASYKNNGFDIQALAVVGSLGDEYKKLNTEDSTISGSVNGQYLTIGYDILHQYKTSHKLFAVLDLERLDLDADDETQYSDNYKFVEYSAGIAYFPDPKVVIKAEFATKDYASNAKLADESVFTATAGFIF